MPTHSPGRVADEGSRPSHVVVVLNFNGREDTLRCLTSLVDGNPDVRPLLVDNGSVDGTVDAVRERWPGLDVVRHEENLGFAGGMNAGLTWALERDTAHITVLNNDTTVPPGVLSELARLAVAGAAVSPVVRYRDNDDVWFGGGTVDADTGLARHLTATEIGRRFPAAGPRGVDTLAGCCVTASADTWRTVGGFDERYFLIFEDADWSMRARARGVALIVDPSVPIRHAVSASFSGDHALLGLYYYARNGLLFGGRWRRHTGTVDRWGAFRFLRRHVLPHVSGPLRSSDWVTATDRQLFVTIAVVHHAVGLYGRAPTWVERLAAARAGRDNERASSDGESA